MTTLEEKLDSVLDLLDAGEHTKAKLKYQEARREAKELIRFSENLLELLKINRELGSLLDPDRLLELIMDRAMVLVGAERGFLVLADREDSDFDVAVARQIAEDEIVDTRATFSYNIIKRVIKTQTPMVTTNAQDDPRLKEAESIAMFGIRSVLAVPLVAENSLLGAIYVDTRLQTRAYTEHDLTLLEGLAGQAAVTFRIAHHYRDLKRRTDELERSARC